MYTCHKYVVENPFDEGISEKDFNDSVPKEETEKLAPIFQQSILNPPVSLPVDPNYYWGV